MQTLFWNIYLFYHNARYRIEKNQELSDLISSFHAIPNLVNYFVEFQSSFGMGHFRKKKYQW